MGRGTFVESEMVKSKAFRSFGKTSTPGLVLMDFLLKRKVAKQRHPKRNDCYHIINNGEIQYSYKEAEDRGITRPAFRSAIDALMARGFINIAHHGAGGKKGDVSLYEISDEWRNWKEGDVIFTRPKDTRKGVGFALVHSRKKENIGNDDVTPTSNDNVTSKAANE